MLNKLILLDKDPQNREMISALLQKSGYSFQTTSDLGTLLSSVKNNDYLVLIHGSEQSKVDNLETIQKIKRINPSLPIFLLTQEHDLHRLAEIANTGITRIFSSPADPQSLTQAIDEWITLDLGTETQVKFQTYEYGLEEIPLLKHLVAESPHSEEHIRLLAREARNSQHIFITQSKGPGFQHVLNELCFWANKEDSPPLCIDVLNLHSEEIESQLKGTSSVVGIQGLTCQNLKTQEAVLHFIEKKREMPLPFKCVYCIANEEILSCNKFKPELWAYIEKSLVTIPPLAHRLADTAGYINRYLEMDPTLSDVTWSPEAIQVILSYSWPNNHEELYSFLQRLSNLSDKTYISGRTAHQLINNPNYRVDADSPPKILTHYLIHQQKILLERKAKQSGRALPEILGSMNIDSNLAKRITRLDQLNTLLYSEILSPRLEHAY